MLSRLTKPGRALRAALFAALLPVLVQCGPARNEFAPLCPGTVILGDAADLTIYRQDGQQTAARDLIDLALYARLIGMQGTCREGDRKNQLAVTVSVGIEVARGPALAGREADVPIFVAVTEGDTILDKRVYTMRVVFPSNIERLTLSPGEVALVLPVSATKSGAAYTLVAGFQLTPEQMATSRRAP